MSNDCDNDVVLFGLAEIAMKLGRGDFVSGIKARSLKRLEEDVMNEYAWRLGHLKFIQHAYRMGRFNAEWGAK